MTRRYLRSDAPREAPKPLRISVTPRPDESLIGVIARATRENVLESTSIVLDSAGMRLLHPGTVGRDGLAFAASLATVLGCREGDVRERCYPSEPNAGPQVIRFGEASLIRSDMKMEKRRISPASLQSAPHHRAIWMCGLLPFCPESLELLIDQCPHCSASLGWRMSWGIEVCEHCRSIIDAGTQQSLPSELVEDYRLFARLISPVARVRRRALAGLAPEIAALPPSVLLYLMLQLGRIRGEGQLTLPRQMWGRADPVILARTVARGAEIIGEWPRRLQKWVEQRVTEAGRSDGTALRPFIKSLREMGLPRTAPADQIPVVHAALPNIFVHLNRVFADVDGGRLLGNETCKALVINADKLRRLREARLIRFDMHLESKDRTRVQYDARQVEEIACARRDSTPCTRLEQKLSLPHYAIEQLACLGLVIAELHPAIRCIDRELRLTKTSVVAFTATLEENGPKGPPPGSMVSLGTAMRQMGGHCKPWGPLFAAMLGGEIPYWIVERPGKFLNKVLVHFADVATFTDVRFDESQWPNFPFDPTVTQVDAAEILNIDAVQIRTVIDDGTLEFAPAGVARRTTKASVLKLAERIISTSEAALRLGIDARCVAGTLKRRADIRRQLFGWSRSDFEA
jgi:hypothetical protein